MSVVVRFRCPCGYGPLDVEDNRDAPIPLRAVPVSIFDDNGEGQPLGTCPGCGEGLPDFQRVTHPDKAGIREHVRYVGLLDAERRLLYFEPVEIGETDTVRLPLNFVIS